MCSAVVNEIKIYTVFTAPSTMMSIPILLIMGGQIFFNLQRSLFRKLID